MSIETFPEVLEVLMYLDPSQIVEPETTNVRPWSSRVGDTEAEIDKISRLAATIEEEGQIQPVRVRRIEAANGDCVGDNPFAFELIAGRRRKKAIELINAGRKAGEELKVKAVAAEGTVSDPSAFRQAAIENWHREGLSAMDMCGDIATVRENFKWQGSKGTKKVADFFKTSPATITQYEKLAKLPEDLQRQIHVGELSLDDAFRLAAIAEKQGVEAAIAAAAAGEQAAAEVDGGGSGDDGGDDGGDGGAGDDDAGSDAADRHAHATSEESEGAKKKSKKAKGAKARAIREAAEAAGIKTPRSKKQILEFFTSCYGPAYGHPNGAVHQFVDALMKFAQGELSERTLYKYWDACVDKAPKGTAAAESAAEVAETQTSTKSDEKDKGNKDKSKTKKKK